VKGKDLFSPSMRRNNIPSWGLVCCAQLYEIYDLTYVGERLILEVWVMEFI